MSEDFKTVLIGHEHYVIQGATKKYCLVCALTDRVEDLEFRLRDIQGVAAAFKRANEATGRTPHEQDVVVIGQLTGEVTRLRERVELLETQLRDVANLEPWEPR